MNRTEKQNRSEWSVGDTARPTAGYVAATRWHGASGTGSEGSCGR